MNRTHMILGGILAVALLGSFQLFSQEGQQTTGGDKPTTAPAAEEIPFKSRVSYAIGNNVGNSLKTLRQEGIELDLEVLMRGVQEALAEAEKPFLDEAGCRQAFQDLNQKRQEFRAGQQEREKKKGEEFLAENAKKEGVVVTPSGLQYKIVTEGEGKNPAETDRVKVHYRGTLLDGTEFDSSYKRNAPAEFALNRVIKGWTEGLQLMKPGAKYIFYIPSDLGYGPNGTPDGSIPPGAVLTFEVELLEVK